MNNMPQPIQQAIRLACLHHNDREVDNGQTLAMDDEFVVIAHSYILGYWKTFLIHRPSGMLYEAVYHPEVGDIQVNSYKYSDCSIVADLDPQTPPTPPKSEASK